MTIHVVQPDETVASIAQQYGVDPRRLQEDNEVSENGALAVGQTLVLRFPAAVHAVSAGEMLYSIAQSHGLTVRRLYQNNWPLGGQPQLSPGQTLVLSYLDEPTDQAAFNGYAYPFIDPALLDAAVSYLTYLTPFTYGITAAGGLFPLEDDALLRASRSHGARPVLHLSTYTENDQFDAHRAELVLTDLEVQANLIAQVQELLRYKGFAGVDVDFEYLPAALAQSYAAFLDRLRRVLGPQGYFVWAALAPKTTSRQRGLLYEAHDYAAIGAAVDAALIMTYEWGYTYRL